MPEGARVARPTEAHLQHTMHVVKSIYRSEGAYISIRTLNPLWESPGYYTLPSEMSVEECKYLCDYFGVTRTITADKKVQWHLTQNVQHVNSLEMFPIEFRTHESHESRRSNLRIATRTRKVSLVSFFQYLHQVHNFDDHL